MEWGHFCCCCPFFRRRFSDHETNSVLLTSPVVYQTYSGALIGARYESQSTISPAQILDCEDRILYPSQYKNPFFFISLEVNNTIRPRQLTHEDIFFIREFLVLENILTGSGSGKKERKKIIDWYLSNYIERVSPFFQSQRTCFRNYFLFIVEEVRKLSFIRKITHNAGDTSDLKTDAEYLRIIQWMFDNRITKQIEPELLESLRNDVPGRAMSQSAVCRR